MICQYGCQKELHTYILLCYCKAMLLSSKGSKVILRSHFCDIMKANVSWDHHAPKWPLTYNESGPADSYVTFEVIWRLSLFNWKRPERVVIHESNSIDFLNSHEGAITFLTNYILACSKKTKLSSNHSEFYLNKVLIPLSYTSWKLHEHFYFWLCGLFYLLWITQQLSDWSIHLWWCTRRVLHKQPCLVCVRKQRLATVFTAST